MPSNSSYPEADHPLRAQRPTLNPYRHALSLVAERLKWDLTLESYRSRSILREWKNKYAGQKAVIVCNGPSLLKSDLTLLEGVFTFGLNKINLLFETNKFRPSCIVAVNSLVIEQNAQFYNETNLPLFLDTGGRRWVSSRHNVAFLHSSSQSKFARDVSWSVQQGFTVTYVAMQLAFHLGFRDVALIGCDHNFATKGAANQTVISGEKDASHFDPRYFSGGQKWQLPDLSASEYYYAMAAEAYAAYGGQIINCTVGGRLNLFRRMELLNWAHY